MAWNLPPDRSGMGGVFGTQGLPPWLQDAAVDVPQNQLLPNEYFTPRMRRMQENRPQAWDPEPSIDAAMMAMPPAAKLIGMAPKLATAALAAYYGLSGTDPAGGAPKQAQPAQAQPDPVAFEQQKKLFEAGLLRKEDIDGIRGNKTIEAQKSFDAAQQQQQLLHLQQQQLENQRITDQGKLAETNRLTNAAATEKLNQDAGAERYKQAEANVGPISSALRNYGAPIGTTLGILAGPLARLGVTKASNAISRRAANEAEALFAPAAKGTPARIGNVNEFYRRGGAGAEVPYLLTPGQAPGFAANPTIAGADKLFQPPSALSNGLKDAGITAGFAAESAGSKYMGMGAEADLKDAIDAARKDPSQMNIDRVQTLKDKAAFYDAAMNLGRAGAVSYPASMLKIQRAPSVPSMAGMEAERMKLEALLRKKTPQGLGAPKPLESQNPVAQALAGPPAPAFSGPKGWRQRQFPEGY